jgi:hypothetical protein
LKDLVSAHPCSKNPWQLLGSVEKSTRRIDARFDLDVPISNKKVRYPIRRSSRTSLRFRLLVTELLL